MHPPPKNQTALIVVLVVLIVLGSAIIFVAPIVTSAWLFRRNQREASQRLEEAKEARDRAREGTRSIPACACQPGDPLCSCFGDPPAPARAPLADPSDDSATGPKGPMGSALVGPPMSAPSGAPEGRVKGPMGSALVGSPSVSGGSVSNASSVASGMVAGFRRCYGEGLRQDPSLKGSMRVTAKVGPTGEVLSASPSAVSGLSGAVAACVAARVSSATFAPPEGGGAVVVIPVTFVAPQ